MNIIEVKNNLVKLAYEEDVTLGAFIKISDVVNSYIAQIIHVESSRIGKIAIARLVFIFKGGINAYDGSIPSVQSEVELLNEDFFLNILDKNEPIFIGYTNNDKKVIVSSKILQDKPIICSEKSYQSNILIENIIKQNEQYSKKTVVIDLTGEISGDKLVATKDFEIPLNKDSINYIFNNEFDDLTDEYKAFVQDIFSEVAEYIKTVDYIPFNDLCTVVDYEFKRTQKLQLIILKNKLKQIADNKLFAQNKSDFDILDKKIEKDNNIIIDLSKLNSSIQSEYILYIYSKLAEKNTNFYSIVQLNNNNSSKRIINTIFGMKNVLTSVVCSYSYKYLDDLKQCSKNMFMFTPLKQQNDFGAYNIFLNRLAEDEFILYGKSTKFVPLIISLKEINYEDYKSVITNNNSYSEIEAENNKEIYLEEIKIENQDYIEPPVMEIPQEELTPVIETIEQPIIENEQVELNSPTEDIELPVMEIPQNELNIDSDVSPQMDISQEVLDNDSEQSVVSEINDSLNEENAQEHLEDEIIPESPELQETSISESNDIDLAQDEQEKINIDDAEQDIMALEVQKELAKISIDIDDDEIADAVANAPKTITIEDIEKEEELNLLENSVEDSQSIENDNIDESILTDEDLDMIESLQQNDEITNSIDENSSEFEQLQETSVEEEIKEEKEDEQNMSITDQILQEEAEKEALAEANKPDPIEEQIEKPQNISNKNEEKLETKQAQTPIVPVYSAEIPDEDIVESDNIKQGDKIIHSEFGQGIVEKLISYGERVLCSVNFEQVGRRLLDPKISEIKKIN